jgi:hypothetical protein
VGPADRRGQAAAGVAAYGHPRAGGQEGVAAVSDWDGLTDSERKVLAEVRTCQGCGTPADLGRRLGLPWQKVNYDLGTLRMLRLVLRKPVGKLVMWETTPQGDAAIAEGATQTVEVRGDVL